MDKKAEAAEPELEEPQNPLTKKFTENEWKALKELRVCRYCYRSCAVLIPGLDSDQAALHL